MRAIPRTTFGRMVLLIASILLCGFLAIFLLLRAFVGPGTEYIAALIAGQLSLFEQVLDANPEIDASALAARTSHDIRVLEFGAEPPEALPSVYYLHRLEDQVRALRGATAVLRLEDGGTPVVWGLMNGRAIWIGIPIYPIPTVVPPILALWLFGIAVLSLAGASLAARQINRPLRQLSLAAAVVGKGEMPRPVQTAGPVEIRALADAFNRMARDVNRLAEDRDIVLAGVSHDLRTPLARLRLVAEMLNETDPELSDGLVQDVEDMNQIISEFLALVREGVSEVPELCNIDDLVERVARRTVPPEVPLTVKTGDLPALYVRPTSTRRLIGNLIDNAVKHGNGTPIEVVTEARPREVLIYVRDRGPGISSEDTDRLFEPFTRVDTARSTQGSGLGLAIARRNARMHGGDISLANRDGGGIEVVVRLPAPSNQERRRASQQKGI